MSFKLKNMKTIERHKVVLDLEIENSYLKKSITSAYKGISEKAKIPGFRKGKIPFNVIDLNFGKEYVLNEAASIAISELYPRIIQESSIRPIDYPQVKINKINENEPLDFTVTVEIEPQVDLPKYKGIEVTGIAEEVFEEDIDNHLDRLRNNYATLENVEEEREAQKGDFVTIDFEGRINGEGFEGNSAQDYTLEIGSKTLFETFEDALVGMKKGDKKDVTLTLPEDIANRELSGSKADFKLELKDIKEKKLPEIDESFIKNFGDYKDIKEFKDYLYGVIKEQKKKARKEKIIADIMTNLVTGAKFTVPEQMINNRVNFYKEDLEKKLKEYNITREDYFKSYNLTDNQYNENLRKSVIRELQEYLIFRSLEKAESQNIKPSETQVEEEIDKLKKSYNKKEDKEKVDAFIESPDGKKEIENSVRRRNLIELLIKNAKIKEQKDKNRDKALFKKKLWVPGQKKDGLKTEDRDEKKLWAPQATTKKESDKKDDENKK